jgi:succinoglycan biosynthesis protein ExoV
MKLYYYKDPVGNFGDDLNPWLWNYFVPEIFNDDSSEIFIGIGTLLNNRLPANSSKLVFGSGVGYGKLPVVDDKWKFYCVRGPLSARSLGLDKALAITDPAILITQMAGMPRIDPTNKAGFMPHHRSIDNADWKVICDAAGIDFIDPTAEIDTVIAKIRASKFLITEAMHGAIVADAFRIPWIPVVCYDHILDFKWKDWCQSLDMEYAPVNLPSLWSKKKKVSLETRLKSELKHGLHKLGVSSPNWSPPIPRFTSKETSDLATASLMKLANSPSAFLSEERIHTESIQRLLEKISQLKRDHSSCNV